jgi:hypothetical protein
MFGQIVFGLIGIPLGILIMVKTNYIVDQITGFIGFAEKYLGSGGTYTFFRILGFVITIVSLLVMFGFAGMIYTSIVEGLGGVAGR